MPNNHKPANSDSKPVAATVLTEPNDLRAAIELRAYYLYCERGCESGRDVDDWLAAEQEVLTGEGGPRERS